jgi:hypothetical protein
MQTKIETAVDLWKSYQVEKCEMNFSCGGDSMNDYNFDFLDKDGKSVDVSKELSDEIENRAFNEVTFYEASDGYYIGETGVVHITLDDDGESFTFTKTAESEFSEQYTERTILKLEDSEVKFIKEKVLNINGGDGDCVINFKMDCILSDEEEVIHDTLKERVKDFAEDYEFIDAEGEQEDYYTFSTNEEGDEIDIVDNNIKITINRNFLVYKESID